MSVVFVLVTREKCSTRFYFINTRVTWPTRLLFSISAIHETTSAVFKWDYRTIDCKDKTYKCWGDFFISSALKNVSDNTPAFKLFLKEPSGLEFLIQMSFIYKVGNDPTLCATLSLMGRTSSERLHREHFQPSKVPLRRTTSYKSFHDQRKPAAPRRHSSSPKGVNPAMDILRGVYTLTQVI